jgi:drug/metabolite transporter (DMT)-like permease
LISAILALAASVSWGVADYLAGINARRLGTWSVLVVMELVGFGLLLPVLPFRGDVPTTRTVLLGAAGAIGATIGVVAFFEGMTRGAMAIVVPISGLSPIIPVIVGLATGDSPSALQIAGFVLALGGGAALAHEPTPTGEPMRFANGAGLAVVAMLGFGCYFVPIHAGSKVDPFWTTFAFRGTVCVLLGIVLAIRRPQLRLPRRVLPVLLTIGVLDLGGTVGYALASGKGLLSVVSVLGALYPLTTVALAIVFTGERLRRRQTAGVSVALTGVVLVVTG